MAEIDPTSAAPAPVTTAAPAAESAPAATAAAPVLETSAAPATEVAKAVEPAAPATTTEPEKPAPEAPKEASETLTLLEEASAEAAKAEGESKPEGAKEPPKPEAPKYEFKPYTLPEGFKADDAQIGVLNQVLAEDNLSPQDRGQKLVDLHASEMKRYGDFLIQEQHKVFAQTNEDWKQQIKSDPELGGAGFGTTMQRTARMRDLFVPEKHRAEFNNFLRVTGAGNHPAFIRFMDSVGRKFDEPSPPPPSFKPPPDIGRPTGGAGGRREALYNHPSSEARRTR